MIVVKDLEVGIAEIKKKYVFLSNPRGSRKEDAIRYDTKAELKAGETAEIEMLEILWERREPDDVLLISEDDEDMNEHWDVGVKKKSGEIILYDVKSNHAWKYNTMWVESRTRMGEKGHLIAGKADYYAFRFFGTKDKDKYRFLICKKAEVRGLVESKDVIGKPRTHSLEKSKIPYTPYGRRDNKEVVHRIPVGHLKTLPSTEMIESLREENLVDWGKKLGVFLKC